MEIPLTGNFEEDYKKIWSFMDFPNDSDLRDSKNTHGEIRKILGSTSFDKIKIRRSLIENIRHTISYEDLIHKIHFERARCHVVGKLLFFLAMLNSEGKASFAKARYIVAIQLQDAGLDGRTSHASSHQPIKDTWKSYKSVSHFWAAFILFVGVSPSNVKAVNKKNYPEFIKTSNWFRTFLINFIPPNVQNRVPLAQADELYCLRHGYNQLILERPPFTSVTPEIKALLKHYKAKSPTH